MTSGHGRWVYPLDPECPDVIRHQEDLNDPMTRMAGIGEELTADFARKHRARCERCREYGLASVEVEW